MKLWADDPKNAASPTTDDRPKTTARGIFVLFILVLICAAPYFLSLILRLPAWLTWQ
jgi:hypothetical protein